MFQRFPVAPELAVYPQVYPVEPVGVGDVCSQEVIGLAVLSSKRLEHFNSLFLSRRTGHTSSIDRNLTREKKERMTDKKRDSWDDYFMKIASTVAERATCDRKLVGAIIVVNKAIVSTGFNGAPRGAPHCDEVGHEMKDMGGRESCVRTVHGEANALVHAARTGAQVEGGTLYTTASPCYDCLKLIINAGIIRVVCKEFYASRYGMSDQMNEFAKNAGVEMIVLEEKKSIAT